MKISKAGLDLVKKYEGLYLKAYKCPAGVWTIGWGHTGSVKQGQVITRVKAEELLKKDMAHFEKGVEELVEVGLNQNQFDALVSFSFNVGLGNLGKSTLLKKVNAKDYRGASAEFIKWNKADGKVLSGLTYRRKSEMLLFNKPVAIKKPVHVWYVVKSGDTLGEVAKKYKVTMTSLIKLNKLKDKDLLKVGQKLQIK